MTLEVHRNVVAGRMALQYRRATTADLDLLAEWNHQMIADQGHDNPMTVPQLKERMVEWLSGEYEVGLLECDGRATAYAVWRIREDIVFLRHLFVNRDDRRLGVGRAAVNLLMREIWPHGRRIRMEVLARNEQAIAFWRAIGFTDRYLGMELRPK